MCNTQMLLMTAGIAAIAMTGGTAAPAFLSAETAAGAGLGIGATAAYAVPTASAAISGSTIATGLSMAGTAASSYGAYEQGKMAEKTGEYNAQVGRLKADSVVKDAVIAEDLQRNKVRQIEGSQTASMAANGIDPTTGTASRVLDQTASMGELDAQQIRTNALRQAWGLENQANLDLVQGKAAKQSGTLTGLGTLLAGGARSYGLYRGSSSAYNN